MEKLPYMPAPCSNCPMRKDAPAGWLGKERMQEILEADSFVCHKTAYGADEQKRQCAGHIHLKQRGNLFYRMALMIGRKLIISNSSVLHENESSCIKHHTDESNR